MTLPIHRLKDLRDGMSPTSVEAVYCVRCEEYVGQWRELVRRRLFDEDTIECEECLNKRR